MTRQLTNKSFSSRSRPPYSVTPVRGQAEDANHCPQGREGWFVHLQLQTSGEPDLSEGSEKPVECYPRGKGVVEK